MTMQKKVLLLTVAVATTLASENGGTTKTGSVFRGKRSPRKGLPSFPSPTTLNPTTIATTMATTYDPRPSERQIAEEKIKELFKFVEALIDPNAMKTEEDKLTVIKAVEKYIQNALSGIEDDYWIIHHQRFSTIKICFIASITNTTELRVEFIDVMDSSVTATAVSANASNSSDGVTPSSEQGPINMLRVPDDIVSQLVGKSVIFVVVYYFGDVFVNSHSENCPLQDSEAVTEKINSGVLSCFLIVNGVLTSLPVEILFQHTQPVVPRHEEVYVEESTRLVTNQKVVKKAESLCSYYDYDESKWSQTGCQVDRMASSNEQTLCHCNHTTNFAVLMQVKEFSISETHVKALDIITMIGCSISLCALVVTIAMFIWLETLKSDHNIIHFNLIIALLVAQTIFLSGVSATSNKVACMAVAILLHISFLSVFTWMLMEGVHLYSKVVIVFGTESSKIKYYVFIGWGIPFVIVTIAAAVNPDGYGTPTGCWLDMKSGQVWAFVAPAVLVLLVNIIILVMVLRIVVVSSQTASENKKENAYVRTAVKSSLFLLPILGITWLLGLFAVDDNSVVFQYIFAFTNSLQGLFVFLFQGILNSEVRTAFKRKMEKRALQRGDIVTTSAASHSRTYDRTGLSGDNKTRMTSTSSSLDHPTQNRKSIHSTISNGDVIIEEDSEIYRLEEPSSVMNRTGHTYNHSSSSNRSATPLSVHSILPGAADDSQALYNI